MSRKAHKIRLSMGSSSSSSSSWPSDDSSWISKDTSSSEYAPMIEALRELRGEVAQFRRELDNHDDRLVITLEQLEKKHEEIVALKKELAALRRKFDIAPDEPCS